MDFKNANELLALCEEKNLPISEIMRIREIELGETASEIVNKKMTRVLGIMKDAAFSPIRQPVKSMGGLIGGEARKLSLHAQEKKGLCGNLLQKAITYAMATLETNASMGLIVASPTAGSAGIVPGLMLAMQEHYQFSDEEIIRALFNASAIGYLAMRNATVAGAVGGCQAEVGGCICNGCICCCRADGRFTERMYFCCIYCSYEHAWSGMRSGRRSGRISMSEQKCCRCGKRYNCRRNGSRRNPAVDSSGRNDPDDVYRG